jgi:hypothetical protein
MTEYQLRKEQSNSIKSLSLAFIDCDYKCRNDWEPMSETEWQLTVTWTKIDSWYEDSIALIRPT